MVYPGKIIKFSLGILALIFILTINACEESPIRYKYIVSVDYVVTYQVTGENIDSCLIRYYETGGNQITLDSQQLPWSISFIQNSEFYAHIVAYSPSTYGSPGKLTATILINEEVLKVAQNEDELVHSISLTADISGSQFVVVETDYY